MNTTTLPHSPATRSDLAALLAQTLQIVGRLRTEIAELEAALVDARADRDAGRALAQQAVHALADREQHSRRQADRIAGLRDEIRRYVAAQVDGDPRAAA